MPPVRHRRCQLGVWLVVVAITMVAGWQMFSSAPSPSDAPASPVVAASSLVTQTDGAVGDPDNDIWRTAIAQHQLRDGSSIDLLPSYRWRGAANLQAGKRSFLGVTLPNPGEELGAVLFDIAGLIWALILFIARAVYTMDLFAGAIGTRLNAFFLQLSSAVTRAGLISLIGVAIFAQAVLGYVRGRRTSSVSTVISLMLPLALLFALTAGARQQTIQDAGGPDCDALLADPTTTAIPDGCLPDASTATSLRERSSHYATGSPVWLASTSLGLVDVVASPLLNAFNRFGSDSTATTSTNALACAPYIDALYSSFDTAWTMERQRRGLSPLAQSSALITISSMWEDSFKAFFDDMQYAGGVSGTNISCRQLENQAGTRPVVQAALSHMAGAPAGGSTPPEVLAALSSSAGEAALLSQASDDCGDGDSRCPLAPFQSYGGNDSADRRAYLMAFGACTFHDGQFKVQGAWGFIGAVTADHCGEFWREGGTAGGKLKFSNTSPVELFERGQRIDVAGAWENCQVTGEFPHEDGTIACSDVYPAGLTDTETGSGAARVALNFQGRNAASTSPFVAGLMALITALAFMWVLLGVLLGMLVAKVGFSVLVGLLPGVLLLMALPSKHAHHGVRSPVGTRMFKLMTSWGLASMLLGVAMAFILVMLRLIKLLLGGTNPGSLLVLVTPLVTLVITHFLLKRIGISQGILNPLGGAGLAFAAASVASHNPQDMVKAARHGTRTARAAGEKLDPRQLKQWWDKRSGILKAGAARVAHTPGGVAASYRAARGSDKDSMSVLGAAMLTVTAPAWRRQRREREGSAIDAGRDITGDDATSRELNQRAAESVAAAEALDRSPRSDDDRTAAREQAGLFHHHQSDIAPGGPSSDPLSVYNRRRDELRATTDAQGRQDLLRAWRVENMALRNSHGQIVTDSAGVPVLGLRNAATGELLRGDALTAAVQSLEARDDPWELAAADIGLAAVTDEVETFDWGDEYQQARAELEAARWGVDRADVIVPINGTAAVPLPDLGVRITPDGNLVRPPDLLPGGRTLPASIDASNAGGMLRNWSAHIDEITALQLSAVSPADLPFVIEELDKLFRDPSGAQVNALEVIGLDSVTVSKIETMIETGHSFTTADYETLFDGHHVTIETDTLLAAVANGRTRRLTIEADRRVGIQDALTALDATVDVAFDAELVLGDVGAAIGELQTITATAGWTPIAVEALTVLITPLIDATHAARQLEVLTDAAVQFKDQQTVDSRDHRDRLETVAADIDQLRHELADLVAVGDFDQVASLIASQQTVVQALLDPTTSQSVLCTAQRRANELHAAIPTLPTPRPPHRSHAFP